MGVGSGTWERLFQCTDTRDGSRIGNAARARSPRLYFFFVWQSKQPNPSLVFGS
jgi:hypothetical protein